MTGRDLVPALNLTDLSRGIWAITPHYGGMLAEACQVCLNDQGHANGVMMNVSGSYQDRCEILFANINELMKKCYAEEEVTTELGAYAIAILLLRELTEYTSFERSRRGTGFDYWVGQGTDGLFRGKSRLEVSGIRRGNAADIRSRVRIKLNQTERRESPLPAVVIVVEFSMPHSEVVSR